MTEQSKDEPGIPTGLLVDALCKLELAGVLEIPERDLNTTGIQRLLCENGLELLADEVARWVAFCAHERGAG